MDREKREKILDRIRKLKALAGDRGATPEEAVAAAEAVRRIMQEHGLDQADAAAAEISVEEVELRRSRRQALDHLVGAVASATGCVGLFDRDPRGIRAVYVGSDPAPVIAAYLHDVCYRAVERAADEFRRSAEYQRRRKANTRAAALKAFKDAMIRHLRLKLVMLSWLNKAERDRLFLAYERRTGVTLTTSAPLKAVAHRKLYADAREAGAEAGRAVDINQPIATGGDSKLIGGR